MHTRNLLSILIIVLLVIAVLSSITILFAFAVKHFNVESEIASKCEMINKLTEKSRIPLTKESLIFITDEQNKLESLYGRFKLALESPLNEEAAEAELDPLQFKERLIQTQKKLREDAAMCKLALPESLGFTKYETELSKPSEIPVLIMRLKVIEEIIYVITLAGIESLHEISFADEEAKKRETAYLNLPVSFKIGCTSSELVTFLYRLRLSPFNFIVDDFDIKSAQAAAGKETAADKKLAASLSIRAIALY